MNEQQARYQLIDNFQTVSCREGVHLRADPSIISDQYNKNLSEMIVRYGHEASTHAYVMMSLEDLQGRKSLQTVRGIAQQIVHQACRLKEQQPAGSRHAEGFKGLESRVALLWRHLMLHDNGTPQRHRQMEYQNIESYSPSEILKSQLPYVRDHVYAPFPPKAAYL
jgi:hypothetical protein